MDQGLIVTRTGIIADSRALYRSGVRSLLTARGDVEIRAEVSTGEQLVAATAHHLPDFIVASPAVLGRGEQDVGERVRAAAPAARLVVVIDGLGRPVSRHADAWVTVHASPEALAEAVGVDRSSRGWRRGARRDEGMLSGRQVEVLGLTAQGLSNREVGEFLHISPSTVKRHLADAFRRLRVHTRVAAISKAVANGVLPPPQATTAPTRGGTAPPRDIGPFGQANPSR